MEITLIFIKAAEDEFDSIFRDVTIVNVDTRAAWYLCNSE